MLNKRYSWLFPAVFLACFFALAVHAIIEEARTPSLSETVARFRSDFSREQRKEALREEVIARKKRFLAYGSYLTLPRGRYKAVFSLSGAYPGPTCLELQIASDRGRSLLASRNVSLEEKSAEIPVSFALASEKEVEPRVRYISGSEDVRIASVQIQRTGGLFPWKDLLTNSLLYAAALTLILLAVLHTFQPTLRWKLYLSAFLFFLGCFLILRRAWLSEDAFITLRHVENLVSGWGPVFNIGERVEGFTHPLWFGLVSLFRKLGLPPKGAAILPGLAASFMALYLLLFRMRFSSASHSQAGLNPAAAALIGTSAFIDFGTSGLETSLSYLLLVAYACEIARDRYLDRPFRLGLTAALLVLNRPDFGIFLLMCLAVYLFAAFRKTIPFIRMAQFLLFPAGLLGGYEIFRMGTYAALFPNPFYAKSGAGSHIVQGLKYLWDFSLGSLFLPVLALALLMPFLQRREPALRSRLIILFSGLLHGFFVVRGGGDFMHGRFLLPAFVLITCSLSGAFDRLFERTIAQKNALIGACLLFLFLSLALAPVQKRGNPFHYGISDERSFYYKDRIVPLKFLFTDTVILMWKTIGKNYRALAEKTGYPIRIAFKNVGFTGFYAGSRVYVCDTLGLNDPVVSRVRIPRRKRPGHEKTAPFGYLMMRKLTFRKTPFPLWNEAARTRYGVLWDLSPRALKAFRPFLRKGFKENLDRRIIEYLEALDPDDARAQADFLFFLQEFWLPHAPARGRELFHARTEAGLLLAHSPSFQWVQQNRDRVNDLLSRIQGPLTFKKFVANIAFAVTEGRRLSFPLSAIP